MKDGTYIVRVPAGCQWTRWALFMARAAIPFQMTGRVMFWIADKMLDSGARSVARTYTKDVPARTAN